MLESTWYLKGLNHNFTRRGIANHAIMSLALAYLEKVEIRRRVTTYMRWSAWGMAYRFGNLYSPLLG